MPTSGDVLRGVWCRLTGSSKMSRIGISHQVSWRERHLPKFILHSNLPWDTRIDRLSVTTLTLRGVHSTSSAFWYDSRTRELSKNGSWTGNCAGEVAWTVLLHGFQTIVLSSGNIQLKNSKPTLPRSLYSAVHISLQGVAWIPPSSGHQFEFEFHAISYTYMCTYEYVAVISDAVSTKLPHRAPQKTTLREFVSRHLRSRARE